MAVPPSIDRTTFLTYLRQSALVEEDTFAAVSRQHLDVTRGKVMARKLVEQGVLTRFQAERLLGGVTTGFFMGPYRILELLGKGGMGRVYKAEHRSMKRIVALKVLSSNTLKTERAVQLFLHEIRAVGVLQHPNIVSAYDANEVQGKYYLVLEYVDGPNLDQLVRQQGPLPVGLACDYVRQAANGLQFAHELGMVHRDVKPANILVQRQTADGDPGLVKLGDFGLARLATPTAAHAGTDGSPATIFTRDNTVMGTPDYLSPEQSRDLHQTDIRSDLYSLGCSFYFLLTGEPPYAGGSALEKIIRHATEVPRPLTSHRADLPAEVVAVVTRLMAKQPDDRFRVPAELARALAPFAVTAPTPWLPPRSAAECFLDIQATPHEEAVPDLGHDLATQPAEDADLATLASGEVDEAGEPAPPPLSAIMAKARQQQSSQVGLAVLVAVVLAVGCLGLITLIALLSGAR